MKLHIGVVVPKASRNTTNPQEASRNLSIISSISSALAFLKLDTFPYRDSTPIFCHEPTFKNIEEEGNLDICRLKFTLHGSMKNYSYLAHCIIGLTNEQWREDRSTLQRKETRHPFR